MAKATRQGGKNKEVVTEEKSALLFSTQINLGKEIFNITVGGAEKGRVGV